MARARRVRLLALDVDGVLTDGGMYYGPAGEVLKKFNTRDGMGLQLVREAGLCVALVTGEDSPIVRSRAAKLRLEDVFCGIQDKLACLDALLERLGLAREQVAYVGDDVNDLPVLQVVGLAVAVADAARAVRAVCHYVTARPGGAGAVREVCELLLAAPHVDNARALLEQVY
ncbi:MAG: HAD hydrolase family protein [Chloroflexi bacterium]|nr:HAD hydrolase family protein [Chloroflexota bacterium]